MVLVVGESTCEFCGSPSFVNKIVVSRGNPCSKLMLIGEAPGAKEDELGKPFVGRSGKVLNNLLSLVGLDHNVDVYICNLVKSRPPNNRPPTKLEISNHLPWLYQQIKLVDPLIIILIGSSALNSILGTKSKITEVRGKWHNWKGISVIPIFHPSYLLRNPSKLRGKPYDLTVRDFERIVDKLKQLKSFSKTSIGSSSYSS